MEIAQQQGTFPDATKLEAEWTNAALLQELADPAVQDSLVELIRKLPRIAEAVSTAERGIELVSAVAGDKATLSSVTERIDQAWAKLNIDHETLDALITLIEKLPKLVKMITVFEQLYDTAEAVLSDKQSMNQLLGGVKELASPVTEPLEEGIAVLKEAKARAATSTQRFSLFAVMRMLGDPTVQNGLRFTQSLLDVVAERKKP
ncbi:DUF1641 domain-containing protein [Brevibacillus fluminis]|uniref:DUF1641 domain-containing protein n=1 Tax=Brevibacillus fluminis TaxID=511487 RepID=A0A3M8DTK5_9BACL|nr:DUF1641 domain-containing protein [Brevibacillus fluminis]RNB91436.1 DUF1641 domain-containing protein [Brevibacillus fluminis]